MLLIQLLKLLFSDPLQFIAVFLILFAPLLISITIHEWAHGYVAYTFGDMTPKTQGRLSLNPFKHLDPIGTLMLFIIGIGWAKPVNINPENINENYKKLKLLLIALAGPLSNFILGIFFIFTLYFLIEFSILKSALLIFFFNLIIKINFVLALFNLIPIPPLDGANILANLMPEKMANIYFKIAPYSLIILVVLIMMNGIDFIFNIAETLQHDLFNFLASFH